MDLTIYFVGATPEEAQHNLPFDSYESAESFALDNPGTHIFAARASVDFDTLEEVSE